MLLDLTDSEDGGVPDGFAVDVAGNLWASGPGGIVVSAYLLRIHEAHFRSIRRCF